MDTKLGILQGVQFHCDRTESKCIFKVEKNYQKLTINFFIDVGHFQQVTS